MSNTIELAKSFVPKLDECYRLASLTSVLDGAPELAKQGANANELIVPMMSMDRICEALDCDVSDLLERVPSRQRKTGKDLILEQHGNRKTKQ